MRKRGGSTLQSELSTANRSDEANRCGEQESGEWKHDHHCDSPNYLLSDHSHYECRRGDAEQGRKYAAAGADEMTSLSLSMQNCRDCSDNLDHESRFIACEKRLDRELARHGKRLSLHLNQNIHTFPSSGAAGAFERKDMCHISS